MGGAIVGMSVVCVGMSFICYFSEGSRHTYSHTQRNYSVVARCVCVCVSVCGHVRAGMCAVCLSVSLTVYLCAWSTCLCVHVRVVYLCI